MGLSRLDNFLKNARGNILYVNPNDLDATDSIENQGNSLTRPFKTIQRALIESARFSYQKGLNNDRFGKTTILVYPGDHVIDNRPGWIPDGENLFRLRNGGTSSNLPPWDLTTNYDLTAPDNALYKMNSIYGGVILPRGTSLVGFDLRKTKIRPKYVPDPTNADIERSSIFRVTGACYFWQFTMFDGDPNGQVYIDYTANQFVPNFSHHKLACFEYADGVNPVTINDAFMSYSTTRTDLDMYYEKVGLVYGEASGRTIEPDYPSSGLDIQPKVDEYRIVGSIGESVGITSIRSGDGVLPSKTITVTTAVPIEGLDVDTPFRVEGITASGYNGQFVVTEKLNDTQISYQVQNAPLLALPSVTGATLSLQSDTVTSASPYVFNCSLRSVFGMCGLNADGARATGFKSMVVAQFTGIGLQKDDQAFVIYNEDTGVFDDNTTPGNETLSNNSRAVFKPEYANFHIKATNNSVIQAVSIFAIGFAEHFVVENGGDASITNSNSNFGAKSLIAKGFRKDAFLQDDVGYITHIIPPKEIPLTESAIEFSAIDVDSTVGVASTGHLYLYNEKNVDVPPENVLEGFRVGARESDAIKVLLSANGNVTEYSSRIVMPGSQTSSEKFLYVNRSVTGINSISNNAITFQQAHSFINGETIRVLSDTGQIPDGLTPNQVYFAVTNSNALSGLTTNTQIKVAKTLTDALNGNTLSINSNGGILSVVSRVSDKNSGDIGHPIQYDISRSQWYVKVSTSATDNTIYNAIVSLGSTVLGEATPRTFIKRKQDNRNAADTTYRFRYVLPAAAPTLGRPPSDAFIIQESNTSIGSTTAEIQTYFGSGSLTNVGQQRNYRFIANANWSGGTANILTELPHNLTVGAVVELNKIKSAENVAAVMNDGYNGTFVVTGISSSKQFSVGIVTSPGGFQNDINTRDTNLPHFKRKNYTNTYYVFRTEEAQNYIFGEQDGIYYLTVLNASNSPTASPFTSQQFSQPVKELYPQTNRDNPQSDPDAARSYALSSTIGEVVVNDVRKSVTKETVTKFVNDIEVGVGLTDLVTSVATGGTSHIVWTEIDHGFNRITRVSIANSGLGYGSGSAGEIYNAKLVGFAGSTTGQGATAKITVDAGGGITNIKIMDGGSAYGIGNTLAVVGVTTTLAFQQAVVTVTQIYNNVGDVVRISGVTSETYLKYNDLYRVSEVYVGAAKSFTVASATPIIGVNSTGVTQEYVTGASAYNTGQAISVNTIDYNFSAGIATVTTKNRHGLRVDAKVRVVGADQNTYNGSFIVREIIGQNSLTLNLGIGVSSPSATGKIFIFREGITSNDGIITADNENLNGRMVPNYAGITTTLSALIPDASTDQINIQNIQNLDINIGDYLVIDDEIIRVKTTVPSTPANPLYVFRGVLGTKAVNHANNAVVRKISVNPIEFRRHSINRASGHTFEYVGYGPGNYSTALPLKQDRALSSTEELLSQSTKLNGGVNFYTGMNDRGISFNGNTKISTITGVQEIFETPVQTVTGEDIGRLPSINITNALEGSFDRSVKVQGGPDNKTLSEFNGPVVFTNKITSSSPKGIEAQSLFVQGEATVARKYTVGIATPILAGNPGDVNYLDNPDKGGYLGWVYTSNNDWYRFGAISLSKESDIMVYDQVGIATTSPGDCTLKVGSGSSVFCVDGFGVGIGTGASPFKLHVNGNTNIIGTCYALDFSGDGSGLTNLNIAASGWSNVAAGLGTGIYNTYLNNTGIGNSTPNYNLELGVAGAGTTDLYVNNKSIFVGFVTFISDVAVGGMLTAYQYDLNGGTGKINAGFVTTTTLAVGPGALTLSAVASGSVGIGTSVPREKLDIDGAVRFKTYYEVVEPVTINSNVVTLDLSRALTFTLTVNDRIDQFTLVNAPPGSTAFTLKLKQDSTGGNSVGIDTFRTSGGNVIPIFWPSGVLPIVTTTADRTDIYSFKIFDGSNLTSDGMYGIVGGQNFL